MSAETAWYAAHVSPTVRSADRVELFVKRLGFTSWWPKTTEMQKRPRRGRVPASARGTASRYVTIVVRRPLWPRYLLVALPRVGARFRRFSDDEARLYGLHGLVGTSAGPAVIPDAVVADLQAREAAGEWDRTARHGRKLVPRAPDWAMVGTRVELADGPFASFHAIVEELTGDRAKIAVSIFGRSTSVNVHLSQLRDGR